MIIVGAKGFAKELLQVMQQLNCTDRLVFYDDVDSKNIQLSSFEIIKSIDEAKGYLITTDNRFTLGLGGPHLRYELAQKFIHLGGKLTSVVSLNTTIGSLDVAIGDGATILDGVRISNYVSIGKGALIYYNTIITHDCKIGDYVELSPSVNILGNVSIDSFVHIGAGATLLPGISVGENSIIGAGSVVTKNVPANEVWCGNPAKFLRRN